MRHSLASTLQAGCEDGAESGLNVALLVDLPPVAWLQASAMGGSLPCVVEWLPVPPHDLLLVPTPALWASPLQPGNICGFSTALQQRNLVQPGNTGLKTTCCIA